MSRPMQPVGYVPAAAATWDAKRKMWRAKVRIRISEDSATFPVESTSSTPRATGKKEALDRLDRKVAELLDTALAGGTVPTFFEAANEWIQFKSGTARPLAPSSTTLYRNTLRSSLKPLHDVPVDQLARGAVVRLLDSLGPGAARTAYVVLRGTLDRCVRFEFIDTNPVGKELKPEPSGAGRLESLTVQQVLAIQEKFIAANGGPRRTIPLAAVASLLLATGARVGEALCWQVKHAEIETDLFADGGPTVTRAALLITGTQVDVDGHLVRQELTKTGELGRRRVVIPLDVYFDTVAPLIGGRGAEEFIFSTRNGSMISAANLRRAWREVLGPELRGVTPKSFRRTVAQALADGGGGGMELAQRLLGHTSMAMTVSAYAKPIIPTIDPTAVTGAMWRRTEGQGAWSEAEIEAYYAAD